LKSIKFPLSELFEYEWKVDFIMSDASLSIYNATQSIFGQQYLHGMCVVHFWRNIRKKIASLVAKEFRKELKLDLEFLEGIHDSKLFESALSLFDQKWTPKAAEFLEYFFETWVGSNFCNWYKGSIPPGFSNTNNGIEGFNQGLKSKYTEWSRFRLGEFADILQEVVKDYSDETSKLPFPNSLTITEDEWKKAQITRNEVFYLKTTLYFIGSILKVKKKEN